MRLTRIVASAMAAFVTAGALATMTSSPAAAQPQPSYPPGVPPVTLSDSTVVVGGEVTIFGQGFGPNEPVDHTFSLQAAAAGAPERATVRQDTGATIAMVPVAFPSSLTATTDGDGRYQITFTADRAGVWRITATGRISGVSASVLLTVVSRQLPVTGSQLGQQLGIGAGLLLLGVVVVLLTVVRRRRTGARGMA
jgi:hypothetical protein